MKEKIVYFVTLVIKYTEIKGPLKQKTQKITIYQVIDKKAPNATVAYNNTILEVQKKYPAVQLIAYTVTDLKPNIFDDYVEKVEEDETGGYKKLGKGE
jgi:hypothetical protein